MEHATGHREREKEWEREGGRWGEKATRYNKSNMLAQMHSHPRISISIKYKSNTHTHSHTHTLAHWHSLLLAPRISHIFRIASRIVFFIFLFFSLLFFFFLAIVFCRNCQCCQGRKNKATLCCAFGTHSSSSSRTLSHVVPHAAPSLSPNSLFTFPSWLSAYTLLM